MLHLNNRIPNIFTNTVDDREKDPNTHTHSAGVSLRVSAACLKTIKHNIYLCWPGAIRQRPTHTEISFHFVYSNDRETSRRSSNADQSVVTGWLLVFVVAQKPSRSVVPLKTSKCQNGGEHTYISIMTTRNLSWLFYPNTSVKRLILLSFVVLR